MPVIAYIVVLQITGKKGKVAMTMKEYDDTGNWFRAHGNKPWEFDANGLMRRREGNVNDVPILVSDRKFHWPAGPCPADHAGLTELGL
jgi:uncharacterized protein